MTRSWLIGKLDFLLLVTWRASFTRPVDRIKIRTVPLLAHPLDQNPYRTSTCLSTGSVWNLKSAPLLARRPDWFQIQFCLLEYRTRCLVCYRTGWRLLEYPTCSSTGLVSNSKSTPHLYLLDDWISFKFKIKYRGWNAPHLVHRITFS